MKKSELSPFEQAAYYLGTFANERALPKIIQNKMLRTFGQRFVRAALAKRCYVTGIEYLKEYEPTQGVLMASNHRSFFDQFVTMTALYEAGVHWPNKLFFPTRSEFFYDSPIGVWLNFTMGGGSLYPPIFRDRARADLNRDALSIMMDQLRKPGTLVGIHPEGKRNKNDDPYTLLKAQPGIGELLLKTRAPLIPLFSNGLTNDVMEDIKRTRKKNARREAPIILCFGPFLDYEEFTQEEPRIGLYKELADKIRTTITELGQQEKVIREKITSGEIDESDPGWLIQK